MDDLVTWLLARFDDEERVARASAAAGSGHWRLADYQDGTTTAWHGEVEVMTSLDRADAEHIARHDPARVLAEVDAKRRILDRCVEVIGDRDLSGYDGFGSLADEPNALALFLAVETMRDLALPLADQPGYRDEWKP